LDAPDLSTGIEALDKALAISATLFDFEDWANNVIDNTIEDFNDAMNRMRTPNPTPNPNPSNTPIPSPPPYKW
jgi:hypothetical protein